MLLMDPRTYKPPAEDVVRTLVPSSVGTPSKSSCALHPYASHEIALPSRTTAEACTIKDLEHRAIGPHSMGHASGLPTEPAGGSASVVGRRGLERPLRRTAPAL